MHLTMNTSLTILNDLGKVLSWQFIQKDIKLFVVSLHSYAAQDGLDGGSVRLARAHGSQQVGSYVSHDAEINIKFKLHVG